MKKKIIGIFVITFLIATALPCISGSVIKKASFDDIQDYEFVPGEFIVKFKSEVVVDISESKNSWISLGISSIDVLNEKHRVTCVERLFRSYKPGVENPYLYNIFKFSVPQGSDILVVVQEYMLDPHVVYVEPNFIAHACVIPNDTNFDLQWALHNTGQAGGTPDADIDAPEAWDIETGDSDVVIAISDTGVDWDHPDLAANIWVNSDETLDGTDTDGNGFIDDIRGWDFVNDDNDPMDDDGHGTSCAGIASADTDNNIGMAGVCWNCKIMPVKILEGNIQDCADGIIYAVDNGADVISMSWGIYSPSNLIKDALDYAYSQGAILVAAAGNNDADKKLYPAGYDNVIAVAATNRNDEKVYNSNYGSWIDVAAPGLVIYTTNWNDTYTNFPFTSAATPHVAGLAGLILSKNPGFNQEEVRTIIRSTTDNVDSEKYIGTGRINAYEAIQRDSTPIVNLNSSLDDATVYMEVYINGTASGIAFVNYSVCYGVGIYPDEWTLILTSSTPVTNGVLALWNTSSLLEGETYTVRLLVYDTADQVSEDRAIVVVNSAPDAPTITGKLKGNPGKEYEYTFNAIDLDGDDVKYYIDWDDGDSDETGLNPSGEDVKVKHTWDNDGTYTIRVYAEDEFGFTGPEGTLTVTMPRNRAINTPFQRFLQQHPNLFLILRLLFQR